MNRFFMALFLAVVALAIGAVWYTREPQTSPADTAGDNLGPFVYTCDGDTNFLLTPSRDLSAATVAPVPGSSYPPVSLLRESPTDTGRRYRGEDFELHGRGERVTLYVVESGVTHECSPQPKPNEAPFDWGDAS